MKKIRFALLMLLVLASVLTLAACNDQPDNSNPAAGQISVEEGGMPQTVFVQGEELDFSNGVLTVTVNGQTSEILLNAEGIAVTGYDKDTLGEQTVTISYQGMTTQLKVTVVERMQVVEHVADYLVGDSLDTSKGRLQITRNDGSNYRVVLSNAAVSITGFDGSKTGAQTLTATYKEGDATYTAQFTVNVHTVEKVEFHSPKKTNYNSHDAGMDLTDGYFTLTGNGGKLTKVVYLTDTMVSGFDLTAVNQDNTPLTQKLTASYNGESYDFEIKLVYTNISLFKKEAAAFADLDWTGNTVPQYTAEMGEQALKLMEVYLDLSPADWTHITMEETLNVARVAMLHGTGLIDPLLTAMEDAFILDASGMEFTCVSREGVARAVEILDNEDGDLYRVSPVLVGMAEALENELIFGDMYFGDVGILPTSVYEQLLEVFEHMLEVHDVLLEIPGDWQSVPVETYAAEIQAFYDVIFSNDYVDSGMGYIYPYVANWRETGDAFDILYHYYYHTNNSNALNALASVNLPSSLSVIAYHVTEMINQVRMISEYAQMDTTLLMYHYHTAVRLVEELKAGDDEMAKNLYNVLPVNSLLGMSSSTLYNFDTVMAYLRIMDGGYYQCSGGLLGVEAYHKLMAAYMNLITNMLEDEEYEDSAQYGKDLENVFALFVELKPTEQYYFLNTLNAFYSMSVPPMAFDDTGEAAELMCFFVTLVHEYYRDKLSEGSVVAYNDLVLAMEIYAQRMNRENWKAEFTAKLDNVQAAYDKMNADDKAAFDKYLRAFYDKYVDIRDSYVLTDGLIDLGEWADEFEALDEAVLSVEVALSLIQKETPVYGLFFSAYERAQRLADYILQNAPAEIVEAYYYEARYGANAEEDGMATDNYVASTYEYVMTTYRNMYINYLLTTVGYDAYLASKLPAFLNACYDLEWNCIYQYEYDRAHVLGILKSFRELSLEEQIMFVQLEGENGYYYEALTDFFAQTYTEAAAKLATSLLSLEEQCILYNFYVANGAEAEDLAALRPGMERVLNEVVSAYEALSAEDKASFADLEEMYTYYKTLCDQALAG